MRRPVRVTDHALVRFLERAGGMELEPLRQMLAQSLDQAVDVAKQLGETKVTVIGGGLRYVVCNGVLVTVTEAR